MQVERQPVPLRALIISIASLVVPVVGVFQLPDWTSSGAGMLIWLTALIPAFLLSYYRGMAGVAVALSGGMAVITATQVSISVFSIAQPDWGLLMAIVGVYLVVSLGVATLSELLLRERRKAEEVALLDRLTGLPNRRYADMTLEGSFAAAERGKSLTIVMFDLDKFKAVNDTHGHAAGDLVLQAFSEVLKTTTRRENLSARFGGEEFITVLRDTVATDAEKFAERVLDRTREKLFPWGFQTASAGIAEYEKGMGSFEILLSAADQALYSAKENGRDQVCIAPRFDQSSRGSGQRVSVTTTTVPIHPDPRSTTTLIWVVDDDDALRGVLTRVLEKGGFTTWNTGNPREALDAFASTEPDQRPTIVLTDVIMPEMSGITMAEQFARLDPLIKVVYMSGYVQSKVSWEGVAGSVVAFLEKPIEMKRLLATMHLVKNREPLKGERVIGPEKDDPLGPDSTP